MKRKTMSAVVPNAGVVAKYYQVKMTKAPQTKSHEMMKGSC